MCVNFLKIIISKVVVHVFSLCIVLVFNVYINGTTVLHVSYDKQLFFNVSFAYIHADTYVSNFLSTIPSYEYIYYTPLLTPSEANPWEKSTNP